LARRAGTGNSNTSGFVPRWRATSAHKKRTARWSHAGWGCRSPPCLSYFEPAQLCTRHKINASMAFRTHALPHPSLAWSAVRGVPSGLVRGGRALPECSPAADRDDVCRHRSDTAATATRRGARGEKRRGEGRGARGGVKWERAAPGRRAQSRPCAHLLRTRLLRGVRGEGAARSNIVSLLSRLSCLSHVSLMSPLYLPSFPTRSAPAARRDCSHLSLSTLRFSSQLSRSRRSSSAALYAASASLRRGVKRGRGR